MHSLAVYLPLTKENSFVSSVKCQKDTLWTLWILWGFGEVMKRQRCESSTHSFPSIRSFPVPLDKGSHSLGQSIISWITLHFYHCFYDTTSPVCFPSSAMKQRGPETLMEQLFLAYQSLDPELWEEGSTIQGLGCIFGSSLCCWRGGGGLSHRRNALPECCFFGGTGFGAKWARMNSRWMHLHRDLEVPRVCAPWCKRKRRDS